jgi:hypothetical protein
MVTPTAMRRVALVFILLPLTGLLTACDEPAWGQPYAFVVKIPPAGHPLARWLPYAFWEEMDSSQHMSPELRTLETFTECEGQRRTVLEMAGIMRDLMGDNLRDPEKMRELQKKFTARELRQELSLPERWAQARCVPLR